MKITTDRKLQDQFRSSNTREDGMINLGDKSSNDRKSCYHVGDIMMRSAQMLRMCEIEDLKELDLNFDIYSAMLNKKINDKSGVTEEENNKLAEHILQADVDRLFDADVIIAEALHSSIGSLCELGILHGWQTASEKLDEILTKNTTTTEKIVEIQELKDKMNKDVYVHSWDLRTTDLNEAKWRRSHSINQLLYGMIMRLATDGDILPWEEILNKLEERYKG